MELDTTTKTSGAERERSMSEDPAAVARESELRDPGRITMRCREGKQAVLELPWDEPLADWPSDDVEFVDLPVGTSRHTVRFVVVAPPSSPRRGVDGTMNGSPGSSGVVGIDGRNVEG